MIRFLGTARPSQGAKDLNAGPAPKLRALNFWILLTGCFSVAVAVAFFLLEAVNRNLLFNSDTVYLPMLFDDLLREGGSLSSWHLTPAPGFFPDMVLFFMARSLLPNTLLNFTAFAVFQVGLAFLATLMMIRAFDSAQPRRLERGVVFGVFFVTAVSIFSSRGAAPYVHIFLPVYRFGATFNSLILTSCMFMALDSHRVTGRVGLGLICMLATASDLMFVPMAIAPAIVSIALTAWKSRVFPRRTAVLLSSILVVCSFLGWLVKQLIVKDTMGQYIGLGFTPWKGQVRLLFSLITQSFVHQPLAAAVIVAFFLAVAFKLFGVLASSKGHSGYGPQASDKMLYILLFIVISPLMTLVAIVTNGIISGDGNELRYISNLFWFPIFFSWLVFQPFGITWRWLRFALGTWLALVALQLSLVPKSGFSMDYYPPLVECVDRVVSVFAAKEHVPVRKGISQYWEAKLITHFSRKDLSVLQFLADLSPYLWINNEDWYLNQRYDFAVLADNSQMPAPPFKERILSLNGQPKETRFCSTKEGAKVELMLYGSQRLRVVE